MAARRRAILTYERDKENDYRPHEDGSLPFQAFVESDQMRRPLILAGMQVIIFAKEIGPKSSNNGDGHYVDNFVIGSTKTTMFKPKRYPAAKRAVVEVENLADHAAAVEFGSGRPSVGDSSGQARPQGGYNEPMRPLGRAAARLGDFHE